MKEIISDEIKKKLLAGLDSVGADQLFGSPIELNGETVVPVAKIKIELSAAAKGSGGGAAGLKGALSNATKGDATKGSGGGDANAGVKISIEPSGFISSKSGKPELVLFGK